MLEMDRNDGLIARALFHVKHEMQRVIREKTPSIDWERIYSDYAKKRAKSERKAPENNPVNFVERSPMVDS